MDLRLAGDDMDLTKMALRVASRRVARGMEGDLLHEVGRDAELGTDVQSQETHHDLEPEDLEDVDTRPKQ